MDMSPLDLRQSIGETRNEQLELIHEIFEGRQFRKAQFRMCADTAPTGQPFSGASRSAHPAEAIKCAGKHDQPLKKSFFPPLGVSHGTSQAARPKVSALVKKGDPFFDGVILRKHIVLVIAPFPAFPEIKKPGAALRSVGNRPSSALGRFVAFRPPLAEGLALSG
jgi:hypothetical protein